jgi:hypothetical protein
VQLDWNVAHAEFQAAPACGELEPRQDVDGAEVGHRE